MFSDIGCQVYLLNLFQVLSKGSLFKECNVRFPKGGPKRGNPTMTTNTVIANRKGDPQQYVEGKTNDGVIVVAVS